jgi:hypothetical protein
VSRFSGLASFDADWLERNWRLDWKNTFAIGANKIAGHHLCILKNMDLLSIYTAWTDEMRWRKL